MDREAWQATVYEVLKESDTTEHAHTYTTHGEKKKRHAKLLSSGKCSKNLPCSQSPILEDRRIKVSKPCCLSLHLKFQPMNANMNTLHPQPSQLDRQLA